MSWTDIFLIPFKIAQDRFKNQNPLIRCKEVDPENIDDVADIAIQDECNLRSDLIDVCVKSLWGLSIEQLKEMIFGADYYEYEDGMLDTLKRFKLEDAQTIVIDTMDKLIIDELIRRLENSLNSSNSLLD